MTVHAEARVREALERIRRSSRPEAWISVIDEAEAISQATTIDSRVRAGDALPLAGLVFAVKDNIDVAGFPTTASYPPALVNPQRSATAAQLLLDAGAICLGKTNMDQFATGLVGTRSPFGVVRHARKEEHISGGSSSGSAVAVALGEVDFALATDTAGSGRVPASFHGLVGIKPSLGSVSREGMMPAAAPYDTITVLAKELSLAATVFQHMLSEPVDQHFVSSHLAAPTTAVLGIPDSASLQILCTEARESFRRACDVAVDSGMSIVELSFEPFFETAALLYESAFVAERTAAFGRILSPQHPDADATVASIVQRGLGFSAVDFIDARERLSVLSLTCKRVMSEVSALLVPTVPHHPTIAQVNADPVQVNSQLGTFTNFVNLLDLAAVAVPVPGQLDGPFGVTILTPNGSDAVGFDIAARVTGESWKLRDDIGFDIAVFGAHMRGQPLNRDLTSLGARYLEDIELLEGYRMVLLDTVPPKPGIEFGEPDSPRIGGELWRLSSSRVSTFMDTLPEPMLVGPLTLVDGRRVTGFGFRGTGSSFRDISQYRRWDAFLESAETRRH